MSDIIDIVVIGGGIHGAGVAQQAAAQGYRALVLEKNTVASGTSSRSSKLIHGGLRYLESAQFGLVKECLHERKALVKIAPDLVKLKPFYIPVYQQTRRHPLTLMIGLGIYGVFTGFDASAKFRLIPRKEWSALDGLNQVGLRKVLQYWDAQTDDAKLTLAVMQSAQKYGAQLKEAAELTKLCRITEGWQVTYTEQGSEKTINTRVVINASGPWVNETLDKVVAKPQRLSIDLVQGTHIVLDGKLNGGIYYVESPVDGRAIFVMPRGEDEIMIGTTETIYEGDPDNVVPLASEIRYLLESFAFYFPSYKNINESQVKHAFAGLRVLPSTEQSAFKRSRDTILHEDKKNAPGLLSIYGGKLTAYRITAERVMRLVMTNLPKAKQIADTCHIKLC